LTSGASRPGHGASPALPLVLLAFALVYLIWGSTYLAIRFAIETLPPLLMAGVRFLIAGALLYGWGRWRGAPSPSRAQWRAAMVVGALLLLGGNGAVVVAQQWIPSGLAALVGGTVPLWMVFIDWGWGDRTRPTLRVWVGLGVGFGGVAILAGSPGLGAGGVMELVGGGLVLAGGVTWALGSIYTRRAPTPMSARLWVGMQMLCGGLLLLVAGVLAGEWGQVDPAGVSMKSTLALVYLIVFGAIVGYSAYIWLLRVSTPARVSTYAYVNPVVALFLGWWLASEPLTPRSLLAATVIIGAVVVTTWDPSILRKRGPRLPGVAGGAPPVPPDAVGGSAFPEAPGPSDPRRSRTSK
jgi:drug/metabolite transporter (DMT)-like permease